MALQLVASRLTSNHQENEQILGGADCPGGWNFSDGCRKRVSMPILAKEMEISPDNIFDLSETDYPWVVVHVRSRQEKVLARHLATRSMSFYLPQIASVPLRGAESQRISHRPLFPGYVFVRPASSNRIVIWQCNVAASVLDVPNQQQLTSELQQIRALQAAGASFVPVRGYQEGDSVRITEGAFRGYSGVVVRTQARERLTVQISMLRQAVQVEFPLDYVEPDRALRS